MGLSWGGLGVLLAVSGLSWAYLGLSWGILGGLGGQKAILNDSFTFSSHFRSRWGLIWTVLGLSWALFGPSWACLEASWAVLEAWKQFWTTVARFQAILEAAGA